MTKYYIDTKGEYIGGFCGNHLQTLPKDSIEISEPPIDARQKWDFKNKKWLEIDKIKYYASFREKEYPSIGDQLDVILKGLNSLRLKGMDTPHDLNTTIDQWLAVKSKYPKS